MDDTIAEFLPSKMVYMACKPPIYYNRRLILEKQGDRYLDECGNILLTAFVRSTKESTVLTILKINSIPNDVKDKISSYLCVIRYKVHENNYGTGYFMPSSYNL